MTISYTLQPIPIWYFSDLTGRPLAGGKIYSYSSLDPTQAKPIYQDPSGTLEWPNPIILSENGSSGPFYWKLDSTDGDDLYFLQIYDNNGNLVDSIDKYPISGGGGGGTVNTVQKIDNLLVNSSFLYNVEATTVQPVADNTYLAPSAHTGLYYKDITFIQSGVSDAVDTVSFNEVSSGLNPFSPDFAPIYYLNYTCSNNPTGESFKGIRFPIAPNVNTLANQEFTFVFYARSTGGGANQIDVQCTQYFGTGGSPDAPVFTSIAPLITLTSSFTVYSLNFSVPSVTGKVLGDSNDDATYIDILLPTSQSCNIDIAKPALYAGSNFPNTLYETVEEIEAKLSTPRTGDVTISMNPFSNNPKTGAQSGWIPLNDGTIGNISSNATTRAKADCWLLFDMLWNSTTAANCPLFESTGAAATKGGTSVDDWNLNRSIKLPRTQGRALLDRGDGQTVSVAYTAAASTDIFTLTPALTYNSGDPVVLSEGTVPTPLTNGVTYYAIFVSTTQMKLALSAEAAIAGTAIDITVDGNGTLSTPPVYALAQFEGEGQHQLTVGELAAHDHTGSYAQTANFSGSGGGQPDVWSGTIPQVFHPLNIASQGGNVPHNNMQPSVFYNMIIKL